MQEPICPSQMRIVVPTEWLNARSEHRTSSLLECFAGNPHLYGFKEERILSKGYDAIYRYFWSDVIYFVAEANGKKGILSGCDGHELTPIIMDEIYEMPDSDGAVPFVKDGKA